jgi:hypothetical protein
MAIQDGTRQDVVTRGLLRCGVAAGPLFVLTALTEGAIRADYRVPAAADPSAPTTGPRYQC